MSEEMKMEWMNKLFKHRKQEPNPEYVNVYDIPTKTVSAIPIDKLAPFMIPVEMDGIAGPVWIDGRKLKPNEYQHPPFSNDVQEVLRAIKASLDDVYCLSLEEWEDGFRRDQDADLEIARWLRLAELYRDLTGTHNLSYEQKKDYLKVLLACTNGPKEHVLKMANITAISTVEAQKIIETFYAEKT
jgi:hypothetical protein